MSGAPLPADRWAALTVPTLIMYGNSTEQWLITAAQALADLLPTASLQAVEGAQHSVEADVLAPALQQFAAGEHEPTAPQNGGHGRKTGVA
jgi:pimeloyl-ACP methyl ester carboxylesterase